MIHPPTHKKKKIIIIVQPVVSLQLLIFLKKFFQIITYLFHLFIHFISTGFLFLAFCSLSISFSIFFFFFFKFLFILHQIFVSSASAQPRQQLPDYPTKSQLFELNFFSLPMFLNFVVCIFFFFHLTQSPKSCYLLLDLS